MIAQERYWNIMEQSRLTLTIKTINKNMRYAQVIMWKKKNDICILLIEFSKIMILRTKDRNLRERWHSKVGDPHYMETWDDSTYFSIHYYISANLHNDQNSPSLTSQGQILSCPIWRRTLDVSLMSTQRMKKKSIFPPFPTFLWL